MKNQSASRSFTAFLALSPVLSIYATPIPGLNVAEVIFLLFWVYALLSGKLRIITTSKTNVYFFALVIFMVFSFFTMAFVKGLEVGALIRMVRFCFYYLSAITLGSIWFELNAFNAWVKRIAVGALLFLVCQYFSYYILGKVLRGMIPGLPVYFEEYSSLDYEGIYERHFFRPTSFFLEPAHFSQYMFIALVLALWYERKLLWALAITAGLLLSTSAQGILVGVALWGMYFLRTIKHIRVERNKLFLKAIGFCAVVLLVTKAVQSEVFSNSIGRLLDSGEQGAIHARLSGYTIVFKEMNWLSGLIGYGFGNVPPDSWLPGLAYLLYGAGLIGVALLAGYIVSIWRNKNRVTQGMVVVFILTLIQASVFTNTMVIAYMCLMGSTEKKGLDNR